MRTPWIGIRVSETDQRDIDDILCRDTNRMVSVVELPIPDDEFGWPLFERTAQTILSRGCRILFNLPRFESTFIYTTTSILARAIDLIRELSGGKDCIEGVVIKISSTNTVILEIAIYSLGDTIDLSRVCVGIDAGSPMTEYPSLLAKLRTVCDTEAIPYIIRPAEPVYADSFLHTRYFTAAARLRNAPFVLAATAEPVSASCVVNSIFETLASGAAGLVLNHKCLNDSKTAQAFANAAVHMKPAEPVPTVAVLWPSFTDMADTKTADYFHRLAIAIRDITDYDLLDERAVRETGLERYDAIVLAAGRCYDRGTLDTIYERVKTGAVLMANCVGTVRCPDGQSTFNRDLLDRDLAALNPAACCTMRRIFKGASFHYCPEMVSEQNGQRCPEDGFITMVARVLRRNTLLGTEKIEPDAMLDGVHVARLRDRILMFNSTDQTVKQEILLPAQLGTKTVELPPLEITELSLEDILHQNHKKGSQ